MKFKKDDYIVLTKANFNLSNYTIGNIYKSNYNSEFLNSKDDRGFNNGYVACAYNNLGNIKWRYATTKEKAMYDKENKPCFVVIEAF